MIYTAYKIGRKEGNKWHYMEVETKSEMLNLVETFLHNGFKVSVQNLLRVKLED